MTPFNHHDIEAAAQAAWQAGDVYRATERTDRKKYYCVSMLPYPSGVLHMGHVRNYTINDMMYRQLRMRGMNPLMPMGWDAFGLPAENAAMKAGEAPAKWTRENIATMKAQMQAIGLAIDWSRELATCDPEYYRWNQWLFLKMLEKGIAYLKTGVVNWDPVDQTVLANEQVVDGKGWRSGAPVEKREIPMYYLKITDYAEELLELPRQDARLAGAREDDAGQLDRQERGRALRVSARHQGRRRASSSATGACTCSPRAPTPSWASRSARWRRSIRSQRSPRSATPSLPRSSTNAGAAASWKPTWRPWKRKGCRPACTCAIRSPNESVEVWVGNYVLMAYGDGAVMGVPGHDERDFAFAKKYGLPIKQVIAVEGEEFTTDFWQPWYADKERGRCVFSVKYDELHYAEAVDAVAADLAAKGLGEKRITYRLRDWGISRQRYWGTPIPIIHCDACGTVPVPEKDLPVVLPEDCVPDGSGNPLRKRADFVDVACPKCGKAAKRETDTMDTFVDSSWYYMRYTSPGASPWSTRATITGCRWTSTSAASSTRSCTSCTRASGPR